MNINKVLGKEAELYYKLPNGRIKCTACARLCEIPEGKIGLCGIWLRQVLWHKPNEFLRRKWQWQSYEV